MAISGFKIDVKKCVGCKVCVVACKAENQLDSDVSYRKVIKVETGSNPSNATLKTYSVACNHCTNPACMAACPVRPTKAIKLGTNGKVLITQSLCIGCRRCEWACPYGAPQYNSTSKKVEKCTYCAHNTSRGPACAAGCLTGTLEAVSTAVTTTTSHSKDVSGTFASSALTKPNTWWRDDWNKSADA